MLDSQAPSIPLKTYAYNEIRCRMLCNTKPDDAKALLTLAQEHIDRRWRVYKSMSEQWSQAVKQGQGSGWRSCNASSIERTCWRQAF